MSLERLYQTVALAINKTDWHCDLSQRETSSFAVLYHIERGVLSFCTIDVA